MAEPRINASAPARGPFARLGDVAESLRAGAQDAIQDLAEEGRQVARVATQASDQVEAALTRDPRALLREAQAVGDDVLDRVGTGLRQARDAARPHVARAREVVQPALDQAEAALAPVVAPLVDLAEQAAAPLVAEAQRRLEPLIAPARAEFEAAGTPLPVTPERPPALDAAIAGSPDRASSVPAALARLPQGDQTAYRAIEARLRTGDEASRTERMQALDALQRLVLAPDRLPGAPDAGGSSVLQNLQYLASRPAAPGIDQTALLAAGIRHVQDPARIEQGRFNSCGAGSSQQLLATTQPAEYLRVLGQLAAPDGRATTRGGLPLTRHGEWDRDFATGGRDVGSALFQSAFMQAANVLGYNGNYQNRQGLTENAFQDSDGVTVQGLTLPGGYVLPGVLPNNQAALIGSLLGTRYEGQFGNGGTVLNQAFTRTGVDRQAAVDPWRAATPERPVTIAVNYGQGNGGNSPHWLAVIGYRDGQLTVLNPHGQRETIAEDQVRSHLLAMTYPAA